MQLLKTYFPILFLLLYSHIGSTQSLADDSGALLEALEIIQQNGMIIKDTVVVDTLYQEKMVKDTIITDTVAYKRVLRDTFYSTQAVEEASAKVLAILYNYNNPNGPMSFTEAKLNDITTRYQRNPMISKLLANDISIFPDTLSAYFIKQFEDELFLMRRSPRQKIINLLHNEEAASPSSYLSVSNTLQRYSIPPVENTTSLELAAKGSNQNVNRGIVSAPYFIEGLFEVILQRAEQEVAISFLQRLLGKEGVEDFNEVFPTVVSTFSGQDFTYSNSFLERLRQAFYEDLQLLSIRLPRLMLESDYFKPLQDDPITYNLLVVYSMAGMAQNGYDIDEILPITSRYLNDTYGEGQKKLNFYLAEKADSTTEYKNIITTTEDIVESLKRIYLELDEGETTIYNTIRSVEDSFQVSPPAVLKMYLDKPAYDFEKLLNSSGSEFDLSLLPYLLRGQLDSAYIVKYNTLQDYDKFFSTIRSPEQWRAAGLELVRNLNGTLIEGSSIDEILLSWQRDLVTYALEAERWQNSVDPAGALQRAINRADSSRLLLLQTVKDTKAYWSSELKDDEPLAFDLLAAILEDFSDIEDDPFAILEGNSLQSDTARLEQMKSRIRGVEQRLVALDKKLREDNPGSGASSPIEVYLNREAITPYSNIASRINGLSTQLKELQSQLDLLDKSQAQVVAKERDNAAPLLQLTEMLTQLAYSLRTTSNQKDRKWMTKEELNNILDGGQRQDAFLGLMQQRLLNIRNIGRFSPDGLSQLVELTVQGLPALADRSTKEYRDSLLFYRRASFAANTFNNLLELPLIVKPGNTSRNFIPLAQQDTALASLPAVTKQAMDFIYYLNVKDHTHAISSAIRLFTRLDTAIIALDPKLDNSGKRKPLLNFMRNYGDFIAGLIDARSSNQVRSLINGISDPPGSSRLKRRAPLSVTLNAYLGGTVGVESWDLEGEEGDPFFSMSPTMPIGISISGLLGKKNRSYSAFISFLDLGAMLTYHDINNISASSKFTFKNIFKPGLQLQWNLKQSPFYLALGGQYGPQFLENSAGEELSVNAVRGFFGFGIDVPLKTLYQK